MYDAHSLTLADEPQHAHGAEAKGGERGLLVEGEAVQIVHLGSTHGRAHRGMLCSLLQQPKHTASSVAAVSDPGCEGSKHPVSVATAPLSPMHWTVLG